MNKMTYSVFIPVFLLFLFVGYCSSLKCAQCRVQPDGTCKNRDDIDPPIVKCEYGEVCGTAVMKLIDPRNHPEVMIQMSFGTSETEVTFKGCVPYNYCEVKRNYEVIGSKRIKCYTCKEDLCNLKAKPK